MGFVGKAFKAVGKVIGKVVGVIGKVVGGVFGFLVPKKGAAAAAAPNNLTKQLEPDTPRKIVFGRVASPLDTRYWEVWGSKGEKFDEILATATHRINAYKELYVEDKLAINAAGAVQAAFAGVLTRDTRLGAAGQTGIVAGAGAQYNAASTFDGCANFKLAWVPDEKKLPNGIPSRYTQIVEGAPVYDPRRDSTVPGGSGTHRINDRTTWAYATLDPNGQPIGRNNCLQTLWYVLGWYIPVVGGGDVLVAGRGVDPSDINLATFIAGANACEAAAYYTDLVLSTEDEHTANEAAITADGLIGRLIDPGGLWSYYANVDDTANVAAYLIDTDVIEGGLDWNEYESISQQFNQVGGKYVNPNSPALFQSYPYPLVRDSTYEANLGIKKRRTIDFRQVLDNTLAQRLARLALNEAQYQGELNCQWNYKALRAQAWSIVSYTSERFGWTKLFRVWRHEISSFNGVGMTLREVHPSIWTAGTVSAPIAPGDAINATASTPIAATGVLIAQSQHTAADGVTKSDGLRLAWDAPGLAVRRTEIRYKQTGAADWINGGSVGRDTTTVVYYPLFGNTNYSFEIRHVSIKEIDGPWVVPNYNPATTGTFGNMTYAALQAAAGTANWSTIYDDNGFKPDDNADVTGANLSDGVIGGSDWIYDVTSPTPTEVANDIAAANAAAASANTAATTAGDIAGQANAFRLDVIDANKFSSDEKKRYVGLVNQWASDVPSLASQGSALGLTTEANNVTTTWNAFYNYLVSIQYDQINASTALPTTGPTSRNNFNATQIAFTNAMRALESALNTKASQLANWSNIVGQANAPTNNANRTQDNPANGVVGGGDFIFDLRNPNALFRPPSNMIKNPSFALRFVNWSQGVWEYRGGGNEGPFAIVSAAGTHVVQTDLIPVYAGLGFSFAAELYCQVAQGNLQFDVLWIAADGVTVVHDGVGVQTNNGEYWVKKRFYELAPAIANGWAANAAYARIRVFSSGVNAGSTCAVRRLQMYSGNLEVAYANDISDSALWSTGFGIDTLRPQELGANITENRIADSFVGRGNLALRNSLGWNDTLFTGRPAFGIDTINIEGAERIKDYFVRGTVGSGGYLSERWPQEGGANITENRSANTFLGRGNLALKNKAFASDIGVAGYDNLIPDNNFEDLAFWNIAGNTVALVPMSEAWVQPRGMYAGGDQDFDFSSEYFNLEVGATYEVMFRFYNLAGGVMTGGFWPLIHLPNQAWFSLKHGYGVNPDVADSGNAIVTAEDTGVLRWKFTPTNNYARNIQFRMKSNARGAAMYWQFALRKLPDANKLIGRIVNPQIYNTQRIVGAANTTNLQPSYSAPGASYTVTLPAHTRKIAGVSGPVTLSYGAVSGVVAASTYWAAYIDDPDLTGFASPSVGFTNNQDELLYPNRYHIASGITPSNTGTGGETGTGGGGTKYFDDCIDIDSYMPTGGLANHVMPGDYILSLNEDDYEGVTLRQVKGNRIALADCVEITSASGIQLILSTTTPCTLKGGAVVDAIDILGYELAVQDADGFRWEEIIEVNHVGSRLVAHISCDEGTYGAGKEQGRYIFSHNAINKQ